MALDRIFANTNVILKACRDYVPDSISMSCLCQEGMSCCPIVPFNSTRSFDKSILTPFKAIYSITTWVYRLYGFEGLRIHVLWQLLICSVGRDHWVTALYFLYWSYEKLLRSNNVKGRFYTKKPLLCCLIVGVRSLHYYGNWSVEKSVLIC